MNRNERILAVIKRKTGKYGIESRKPNGMNWQPEASGYDTHEQAETEAIRLALSYGWKIQVFPGDAQRLNKRVQEMQAG